MANETHIEWLLKGVDDWNDRRQSQNFQPDFTFDDIYRRFQESGKLNRNGEVPLYRINLDDAIFMGANLSNVNFTGAKLRKAKFTGARLSNTNFWGADLTDAEFSVGYLGDADLSCTKLIRTELVQTTLTGADLGGSRFWQAKLYPELKQSSNLDSGKGVHNVSDLIKRCFEIRTRKKDSTLYFRGERDSSWELRPSVMRTSSEGEFRLQKKESEMLLEVMSQRPEDFSGMTSALEQLVLAQHYGVKTRLLDVTRNPCVALFSACDERDPAGRFQDNGMDGRLHVFSVPETLIKSFDSDTVSIIANFAKLDRGYQDLLVGKTGEDSLNEDPNVRLQGEYSVAMRRIYHFIRQEKPQFEKLIDPRDFFRVFVVEPKQSFERIRAQAGAFLMSAFHERFERDEILSHNKDIPVYDHYTLTVPRKSKKKILEELSLLNLTRETLYPSLAEVANAVTQRSLMS